MIDIIIMIFCTLGALAVLLAAIGVLRMPDVYLRLSVTTKAATLGIGLILVGAAFHFSEVGVTSRIIAIIFFITVTAPVSAYLIVRASYFIKAKLWEHSIVDELNGMYDKKTHSLSSTDLPDEVASHRTDDEEEIEEIK
ncbi:MAG: monovalent cation/H(+) antiporter subunit G [Chitinophagaceae bacterium]|nr:monovalent cation/H(+) antiporter subunit G [Chitinophagaceae bacterium]